MKKTAQLEWTLWTVGAACTACGLLLAAQAQVFRAASMHYHAAAMDHAASGVSKKAAGAENPGDGGLIGRIDIPALHVSVPVLEGDDTTSLLRGLGHITGTAQLGGLGNVGLAGHRDTYLKPLSGIRPGMEILAADPEGVYHYTVDSTEIVMPEQVSVLDIGSRPELTLITCYPFNYVGAAPKRFVAHAHLVSASPE